MKLGTIEEEAAACRAEFVGVKVGTYVEFYHHDMMIERLIEPPQNRIKYIETEKPEHERALRLRMFRPGHPKSEWSELLQQAYSKCQEAALAWEFAYTRAMACHTMAYDRAWRRQYGEWRKAADVLQQAYLVQFPHKDCPWNGKSIFPDA